MNLDKMHLHGHKNIKKPSSIGALLGLIVLSFALLTGCSLDEVSDGLLSVEDMLRDVYHAARDIVMYEEPASSIPPLSEETEDELEQTEPDYEIEAVSSHLYGYKSLSETEQYVYNEILSCINHYAEGCKVSTLDSQQLRKVHDVMMADHGEIFWMSGYECVTHTLGDEIVSLDFKPKYTMSEMEKDNIFAQIEDISDEWLSEISLSASDYDKSKYVFDLLIENVDYDITSANNQNIISVFIGRSTVCRGYAAATQYLLRKLGIESVVVIGKAKGEEHAWNLVRLDGAWYYTDVTWGNSEYTEGDATKKFINYTYLNMTSSDIASTHVPMDIMELPECESMTDNYFYREGLYYTYMQPDVMGGWMRRAYDNREVITFKLCDDVLYDKTIKYFIDEGHVGEYCPGLLTVKYVMDDSARTIMFRFDEETQ